MTAGPEGECLRRTTHDRARDRSRMAETLRGSVHESPVRHLPLAQRQVPPVANIILVNWLGVARKSGECLLHRPAGNWFAESCFSSLHGGSNGTTSMEAPRLANRQKGSGIDKPEVQAPLAPGMERQGNKAASLACEGEHADRRHQPQDGTAASVNCQQGTT